MASVFSSKRLAFGEINKTDTCYLYIIHKQLVIFPCRFARRPSSAQGWRDQIKTG